jgi:hypothetical protein
MWACSPGVPAGIEVAASAAGESVQAIGGRGQDSCGANGGSGRNGAEHGGFAVHVLSFGVERVWGAMEGSAGEAGGCRVGLGEEPVPLLVAVGVADQDVAACPYLRGQQGVDLHGAVDDVGPRSQRWPRRCLA